MNVETLIVTVQIFCKFLYWVLFIRAIMSWFPISYSNPINVVIRNLTEPILSPIRAMLYKSPIGGTMLDFSIIIAFLFISIAEVIIVQILLSI